jgi:hypothetical protein
MVPSLCTCTASTSARDSSSSVMGHMRRGIRHHNNCPFYRSRHAYNKALHSALTSLHDQH